MADTLTALQEQIRQQRAQDLADFEAAVKSGDTIKAYDIGGRMGRSGAEIKEIMSKVSPQQQDTTTMDTNKLRTGIDSIQGLQQPSQQSGVGTFVYENIFGVPKEEITVSDRVFGTEQFMPEIVKGFLSPETRTGEGFVQNLESLSFLANVDAMRGLGALSNAEGERLATAASPLFSKDGKLRLRLDDETAKRQLEIMRNLLTKYLRNKENGYISLDELSIEDRNKEIEKYPVGTVFDYNGRLFVK